MPTSWSKRAGEQVLIRVPDLVADHLGGHRPGHGPLQEPSEVEAKLAVALQTPDHGEGEGDVLHQIQAQQRDGLFDPGDLAGRGIQRGIGHGQQSRGQRRVGCDHGGQRVIGLAVVPDRVENARRDGRCRRQTDLGSQEFLDTHGRVSLAVADQRCRPHGGSEPGILIGARLGDAAVGRLPIRLIFPDAA
jgi:hypothetical protein